MIEIQPTNVKWGYFNHLKAIPSGVTVPVHRAV